MRIASLHPAHGWRAVYPDDKGKVRIASVVFFAVVEDGAATGFVPLVPDDHDFARELTPAGDLGPYALLGPDEQVEAEWIRQLAERMKR